MANENQITVIGKTNFHNQSRSFGIKLDDRRRHIHVMGKTGMGKSSLLLNMAVSDIRAGHGIAFVDPHGDLAEALLDYVPPERIDDVVYFNPQDLQFPVSFNVLGDVPEAQRHIVADGLVGVFKKIWADSWGPRLEYILRNCILTLLEKDDATLLDIMRLLVDKDYRAKVVYEIEDPMLKSFWLNEFEGYGDKLQAEAIAPIQNKVGQFTSSPLIRNIIGQKQSSFDIRKVMDERKIFIMNLSKGAVGEGGAQLLGAMMITKMQLAAMSRVDIPQDDRKDFFAYIDEFQNFSTDSFAEILSEARKYRLGLILAHQYIEQLPESVRAAVFGNVGTTILFRIGAADAEEFEKEFAPTLTAEDLVNLPKWKIYLKLMIDGVTSSPFSADTLPDPEEEEISMRQKIIEHSRKVYGIPRNTLISTKEEPKKQQTEQPRRQPQPQAPQRQSKSSPQKAQSKPNTQPKTASPEKTQKPAQPNKVRWENKPPKQPDQQQSKPNKIKWENSPPTKTKTKSDDNTPQESSQEPQTFQNPVLAKKLKELFSKSTSPFGESEYTVRAKVTKQTQESKERVELGELMDDMVQELRTQLDLPDKKPIVEGQEIHFDQLTKRKK